MPQELKSIIIWLTDIPLSFLLISCLTYLNGLDGRVSVSYFPTMDFITACSSSCSFLNSSDASNCSIDSIFILSLQIIPMNPFDHHIEFIA